MVLALVACVLSPVVVPAMPEPRIHGLARAGGEWWAGGLRGLYRYENDRWLKIDERAVRQVAARNEEVWVLFGDGSIDKIEPRLDRRAVDVLHGRSKRPWSSFLFVNDDGVILGGHGGVVDLRGDKLREEFSLQKGDVVTAIYAQGTVLWIGTQQSGIYRWEGSKRQRFGFARGVSDPWISAIGLHRGELVIGTATHGLLAFRGENFVATESPSARIRYIDGDWVGTMEGTFRYDGSVWARELDGEATFCVGTLNRRFLGNATSVVTR